MADTGGRTRRGMPVVRATTRGGYALKVQTITRGREVTDLPPAQGREVWDRQVAFYLTHLRASRKSVHTIRSYTASLARYALFATETGRCLDPREVTRHDVQEYLIALADEGMAPTTQVQRFTGLGAFFHWLTDPEEGFMDGPGPVHNKDRPALPETVTPVISKAHVRALLATTTGKAFEDRRDRAILLLMLATGGRRSEIAGVLVEDLDHGAGLVTLYGKGERARVVRFGGPASEALRRYIRVRDDHPHRDLVQLVGDHADNRRRGRALFLVGVGTGNRGGISGGGIREMVRRRCTEAGIPHIHPHQFRHTWANGMLLGGAAEGDVMRLGGWRDRTMVDRYGKDAAHDRALIRYLDPSEAMLEGDL